MKNEKDLSKLSVEQLIKIILELQAENQILRDEIAKLKKSRLGL